MDIYSPDLHQDEMVSFAVTRNGMTWGEGQQGSYIEIPYGRSPNCTSDSNACYVISDGVVYYGVGNDVDWYSCGHSPGIVDSDIVAFFVLSSGKVYDEYLYGGYVKDSYG